MDAQGEVLVTHQGPRTVEAFRAGAAAAQRYLELRAVKDPTPAQQVDLLLAEVDLGKLDLDAARARKDALTGLTPEQEARVAQALTDLEVMAMAQGLTRQADAAQRRALGGRFRAMLQEGRRPAGDQAAQPFYVLILDWAEHERDVATFEQALGALRERYGAQPGTERFFKQQEERLARLKQE
ncbi:MAG: hypothetical protein M9894_22760 [Planctomycetes bacterium]|nr:hypothetical protein [Planctomycetota bacterium]